MRLINRIMDKFRTPAQKPTDDLDLYDTEPETDYGKPNYSALNQIINDVMETEAAIHRATIIKRCRTEAEELGFDNHFANMLARTECKPIFKFYENLAWQTYPGKPMF